MKKHKLNHGFTIIEIILVLAVARLIFLMVVLALLALQRSQRDTQRKNDAINLLAAIIEFQSHNKGQKPFMMAIMHGQNLNHIRIKVIY